MGKLDKTTGADTNVEAAPLPGHAARVDALFREHNRALVAFLQCRLNSFSEAQELAQEAYMRLYTLKQPEQIESLSAYLFRIAANLAVDRLRMRKVRNIMASEETSEDLHIAPAPERYASAVEQWQHLRKALHDLPKKTSQAFVMHMIQGRDFGAIAKTMKISERMVRYHVSNALAHCRMRLSEPETP